MTNTLHFSEWGICIRAQRKENLCAPGAPKGSKVGMSVRQYQILCANDAGRAPRKYPDNLNRYDDLSYISINKSKILTSARPSAHDLLFRIELGGCPFNGPLSGMKYPTAR